MSFDRMGRRVTNNAQLSRNDIMRNLIIVIAVLLMVLMAIPSLKMDSRGEAIKRCNEIMEQYSLNPIIEACLRDIIDREVAR